MHVPSLYTALRKTTWGGLFPVVSGRIERSSLSRNAKGTRYRGGLVVDKDTVVFDKFASSSAGASSDSTSTSSGVGKKAKKPKSRVHASTGSEEDAGVTYNIPGLPKGMVPSAEMIAASKSARYRQLLESQAMRDEEEHDRMKAAEMARRKGGSRGGSGGAGGSGTGSSSGVEKESSASASASGARRSRGFSAQLERLKAKRAAKEQHTSTGGSANASASNEEA